LERGKGRSITAPFYVLFTKSDIKTDKKRGFLQKSRPAAQGQEVKMRIAGRFSGRKRPIFRQIAQTAPQKQAKNSTRKRKISLAKRKNV